MAMKKRFYSVNGQMMGYESGGVKKDFLTDHLGSITAEIDQTQTRTFDTRYSAYGRNNWSTGTGCGFGWVGSYGYRETGLFHMSHYVRARHYSYVTGGWSTVDPLWPSQPAYVYLCPVTCIDYSGEIPSTPFLDNGGYWHGNGAPPNNGYGFGGGIKFDNCMHLDFPIPFKAGFFAGATVGLDICKDVYDTSCCKPPATASQCITWKLRLSVTIAAPVPFNAQEYSEIPARISMAVSNMMASALNLGLGSIPQKGCPQAGYHFDELKVCLKACIGLMSVEICGGTKGTSIDTKFGVCGFPSVKITGSGGAKHCS